PHRRGVAEIVDLNRRRTERQDAKAKVLREAHQIDRDIHLKLAEQICHFAIALMANVDESLECVPDSILHLVRIAWGERDCDGLEFRLVMVLEQSGDEAGDRVIAKIGGQIGNSDAFMRIAFTLPQLAISRLIPLGDKSPCAVKLKLG